MTRHPVSASLVALLTLFLPACAPATTSAPPAPPAAAQTKKGALAEASTTRPPQLIVNGDTAIKKSANGEAHPICHRLSTGKKSYHPVVFPPDSTSAPLASSCLKPVAASPRGEGRPAT